MIGIITEIIERIEQYYGDFNFFVLFILFMIVGLIWFSSQRKAFLIPGLLLTIIVLSPVFYSIWDKTVGSYVYWRALWMIPIIPVLAAVSSMIVDHTRNALLKTGAIVGLLVLFIVAGSIVYTTDGNKKFEAAKNSDKLPENAVLVAEYLLEIDDDPYVVSDASISTYLRQYCGKIKSPYSRSVSYGTPSILGKEIHGYLIAGDMSNVACLMLNHDYEYLVTSNIEERKQSDLLSTGFEIIKQIGEYGIYRVYGKRTEVRTYNQDHQETSMTYVDENGDPVKPSDKPYVKYENEYLSDGSLSLTKFYGIDGDILDYGSYHFHKYLTQLKGELDNKHIIFISIRNDGTNALTKTLQEDLEKLGIRTNLLGKLRNSYYAVLSSDEVIEELSSNALVHNGMIGDSTYTVISKGYSAGDCSSIIIDGVDYSKNNRGMNFVVYDPVEDQVLSSVSFDTYSFEMWEKSN